MRNNNLKPIVILALNQETITKDKALISSFIGRAFDNVPLTGSYKGVEEASYILDASENSLESIIEFAKDNKQECILYLDNQREAYLYYDKDNFEYIGSFVGVSELEAKKHEAWTYNPITEQYFIVR